MPAATPDPAKKAQIDSVYGKLPLQFEANQGQQPERVKFLSRGKDYTLFLTPDGATLSLRKMAAAGTDLRLKLEGANPGVTLTATEPLPGAVNYFIGKEATKWRRNVALFGKVHYKQVYAGIDLVFYGNQRQLEYDFVVAPGASPDAIQLAVEGADRTLVDAATGDLVIAAGGQEIRFHKPVVYQPETETAARREVAGGFQVSQNRVTFDVAAYDHARPLVVDPVLAYSTYLGGSSEDFAEYVTVDKQGNAYIEGLTCSTDFPTTAGSYSPAQPAHYPDANCVSSLTGSDIFVTKLNPAGTALIFSTYLGGGWTETPSGIAVDSSDNVYVAGSTQSEDFPVTAGAFQGVCAPSIIFNGPNCTNPSTISNCEGGAGQANGGDSGFVTKLNSTGSALVYSTLIGGSGADFIQAMALDSSNQVYVAGNSTSAPFTDDLCAANPQVSFPWPTTSNGYEPDFPASGFAGAGHPTFSVLSADGSSLTYSTQFGALHGTSGGTQFFTSIAIDTAGKAYIGGFTNDPSFPVTTGAYQTACPACENSNHNDGTVTTFDPSQTGTASLVYSTFLGGNGAAANGGFCPPTSGDIVYGVAVDSKSNAYVAGTACSADFPTTHGAFLTTDPTGCTSPTTNAFLSKLNSAGSALDYSTYLGGSTCNANTLGYGVSVNSADDAFVTGSTNDGTFPTMNPLYPATLPGSDLFVTEFNTKGSALLFSTPMGSNETIGYGIHVDNYGNIYVVGSASSPWVPTTPGAFQPAYAGNEDGFAVRIALTEADLAVTDSAPSTVLTGTNLTYTIGVTNNGPNTADVITLTDTVPVGTSFVSATTTSGSCKTPTARDPHGTVTCTVSTLTNAASFGVSIVVKVTAASGATLTDTASVSSLVYDATTTNNTATTTTSVN
ncbi:MAG: SBBP repeat-containing protein [Bryobacteraceae bacterium]